MTTTTDRRREQVPALCCECGATRSVARGYAGSNLTTRLRCQVCKRTSTHAPVRDGEDWREDQNRKDDKAVRDVQALTAHIEAFGIDVQTVPAESIQGGKAECLRYIEGSPEWAVRISDDLIVQDRVRMLEWAWRAMLPTNDTSWSGPVLKDAAGERVRGCHYRPGDFGLR